MRLSQLPVDISEDSREGESLVSDMLLATTKPAVAASVTSTLECCPPSSDVDHHAGEGGVSRQ
jgi:hypothetical protein